MSGGALVRGEHLAAQNRVQPRLVTFAASAQPRENVGIDADGGRGFGRTVETATHGVLPELFGKFRDVAEVDLAVGASRKLSQTIPFGFRYRRQFVPAVANEFLLRSVGALFGPLREPR